MEAAPRGDPRGVGCLTGEHDLLRPRHVGDDRQQRLGVGVLGRLKHFGRRSDLDDASEVHHGDAVGDVPRQAEVMCHHQHRQAELLAQTQQQAEDLPAHGGVQAGHGLVGDEHARFQGQRTRDDHALALPS